MNKREIKKAASLEAASSIVFKIVALARLRWG